MKTSPFILGLTFMAALIPLVSHAAPTDTPTDPNTPTAGYVYQQQGVFGCNAGQYGGSPGTTAAIGGVFVPVNDAAVTLDAGILVYKECVLRGVVDKMRVGATAQISATGITSFLTGRNNGPLFPQDLSQDVLDERDRVVALSLSNGSLSNLNTAFKAQVERAIATGYMRGTRASNKDFTCSYSGNLSEVLRGRIQGSIWDALDALQDPSCSSYFAYVLANNEVQGQAKAAVGTMLQKLSWGNGIYDIQSIDSSGNIITKNPAAIVGGNVAQLIQTGYRQLESANDIDQMVNALFAGISTQVVSDNRGLSALTQKTSQNGQLTSYLDQVLRQTQGDVRQSAVNAALQILVSSRQVELAYNQVVSAIRDRLTSAATVLRQRENQCWGLVISKVCSGAPDSSNNCTAADGTSLRVATSTAYSQAVIDSQILGVASSTTQNLNTSNAALTLLNQMITTASQSTDQNAQAAIVQRVDQLVAQRALHVQSDVNSAQLSRDAITTSLDNLIEDTIKTWADSTDDPAVGWCNVNNTAVISYWTGRWKR